MMDVAIIATDLALYFKSVFLFILRITIATIIIITSTVVPIDLLWTLCQAPRLCYGPLTRTTTLGVRYCYSNCVDGKQNHRKRFAKIR